jgi:hypothetical protein
LGPRSAIAALGLALAAPAAAAEVQWEGYLRSRARGFSSLSLGAPSIESDGLSPEKARAWAQHRVWLRPRFVLSDHVAVFTEIRALDGVTWGESPVPERDVTQPDGSDTAQLPPALSDDLGIPAGSAQDGLPRGTLGGNLQLWRAWAEVRGPAGTFRFGRLPVHWGLGIWQNDGLGINADYGDSADRVQWERSFQDVFVRVAAEVDGNSLATPEVRDTASGNAAFAWRSEKVEVGLNTQLRHAFPSDLDALTLFTASAALDADLGNLHASAELVARVGQGDLDSTNTDTQVQAFGGLFSAGVDQEKWSASVEAGFASGDGDPNDNTVRTFQFDRDYNIGILLFEQPLPVLRSDSGRDFSRVLSGNGIANAIFARASASVALPYDLRADVAVAGARTFVPPPTDASRNTYGLEANAGLRYRAYDHVDVLGTAAVFVPGSFYRNYADDDIEGLSRTVVGGQVLARVFF